MGTDVTVLALGRRAAGPISGGRRGRHRGARGEVEPLPAHERALPPERRRGRAGGRVAGDVRPRRTGGRRVAVHRWSLRPDHPSRTRRRGLRPQLRRACTRRRVHRRANRSPRRDVQASCSMRSCTRSAFPQESRSTSAASARATPPTWSRRPCPRPRLARCAREPRRRPARDGGAPDAARLGDRGRRPARHRRHRACSRSRRARSRRARGCGGRGRVPGARCTTSSIRAPVSPVGRGSHR